MMHNLAPYPKYKMSELRGLDKIPSQWSELRAKYLFKEVDDRSSSGNEEMLSVSHKTGVTPRSQKNVTMFLAESNVGHKICRPGDVVINTMWAWMAALGVSRHTGLVSPSYGVYRPREGGSTLLPRFTDELLRTELYRVEYVRKSTGVNSSRLRLYPEQFLRIPILVPPPDEQAAIIKYLDHIDRKISRYIHTKRKLVKLLEEQKQAIIHHAVTRGLDPNVRLRPSGVEWLGELPEHWAVSSIKRLARSGYKTFVDGDWIESPFIRSEGIRLIQTGNIGLGSYREKGFRYIDESTFNTLACTEFQPNDVLICRLGEPVGRACLAPSLGVRMITSVDVCILKPRKDVDGAFVVYAMSSPQYLNWVGSLVRGSTRDRVSRSMLGSFVIPLPPLAEQMEIVHFVNGATANIVAAIERANREVTFLREYRGRLIVDLVTGKLDVREATKSLPDVGLEPEPLDEIDDFAQDESTAEDLELEATDAE